MAYFGLTDPDHGRYQHTPLNTRASIRLLRLLPGQYGTPLKCQIIECGGEVRANAVYEALSYTWGDPIFPEVIHVYDALFQDTRLYISITQNLCNALQRLRKLANTAS